MNFVSMPKAELEKKYYELLEDYREFKEKGLKLDMSRGKPCTEQLELSMDMLNCAQVKSESGLDCRNYGLLDGIPECKRIFAQMLEVDEKNIIVMGNSSLNVMFDYISQCMTHGDGGAPWASQGKIKFACPVPGYDRHFGICEYFGIEMVNVPMLEDGPDMDVLEELDPVAYEELSAGAAPSSEVDYALDVRESLILDYLRKNGESSFDDLGLNLGMDPGVLSGVLAGLEMKFLLIQSPGRRYAIR